MGARCSASGYTHLAAPCLGQLRLGRLGECILTLHLAPIFYHLIGLFCHFLGFWSDLRAAVWRPFRAPGFSNVIFLEISGCLISNGFGLARFGATIIEIWRPE